MRAMLVASGLLIVLAAAYWLGADAIPKSSLGGLVGADGLPKLLAVALGLLSAGLALQTLVEMRKRRRTGAASATGTAASSEVGDVAGHLRALGVIAIGVGFLVALPVLGYALSVALLLVAVATYSGKAFGLGTVVFGVAGAAFFYVLFVLGLDVPLPAGIWPSLLSGGSAPV